MKWFRVWVLAAGLLTEFSAFGAEETNSPVSENTTTTNQVGADVLWAGMHEAGMITEEQYQHVKDTGYLPSGSAVTNSPVPVEEQAAWNKLAQHEVITADELASMMFAGDIPTLTKDEEQAFIDLAPVYQPKRAKRLTYNVRRKHARVELTRLAHRLRKEREEFERRAMLLDIPLVAEDGGVLIHIDGEGNPFYSYSNGIKGCDTISTDEVWATNAVGQVNTNFNLTGSGITLAMWEHDGGMNEDHLEFEGRVIDDASGDYFHPTAVAAVMVGAGINTNAHGTAPDATLHAYKWSGNLSDQIAVVNGGVVRFSNHSYITASGSSFGAYTALDRERDNLVYLAYHHLPVFAVGNENKDNDPSEYDTLNAGNAKNVLGVGAIKPLAGGYTAASNVVMTYYSSWGPTDDGRIKPDIVACGYSGWIPKEGNDTEYHEYGENNGLAIGTSYAAPSACGSLALLQELHQNLYGTNSIPLWASTYKGLIIHTADEAGDAPGPDYRFGWGLMNAHSAADLMSKDAQWNSNPFIKEFVLPDGKCAVLAVQVASNQTFKVTGCWSDPFGASLVNDIDLRIINPNGTTNFPWVLNPISEPIDHRGDPADTGDNTIDNVEQVEITNTVAGAYTVLIEHKGTLQNGGQEVSLILSGLIPENIEPGFDFTFTTNGFPRLKITDALGSVYEISHSDNLIIPLGWVEVPESPMSILQREIEWIDPTGSTNPVRFYKVKRTK